MVEPRRRARKGRLFALLFMLLVIAVAIAAVVVVTAPAPTKVVLRKVVYEDVQQAAGSLTRLVNENTQ